MHFDRVTPLQYFATLVAEDEGLALTEAAAAIAQDEHPQLDPQAVLDQIDTLADRLKRRLPGDAAPLQRLRLLNHYFFNELGFVGNVNDYYALDNSYLHRVLATRRGIPITLALLYLELAGAVGLPARGVSFPGHFLVKLKLPQGEVVIDPFDGRSLSRQELDERLAPYRRDAGLVGDQELPLALFLQPASERTILARLLRNLKEIHRAAEDWPRLLAVLHRLVILLPQDWEERRDRGFAYAELGQPMQALDDLHDYLAHRPHAEDARRVQRRIDELQRHGSRPH